MYEEEESMELSCGEVSFGTGSHDPMETSGGGEIETNFFSQAFLNTLPSGGKKRASLGGTSFTSSPTVNSSPRRRWSTLMLPQQQTTHLSHTDMMSATVGSGHKHLKPNRRKTEGHIGTKTEGFCYVGNNNINTNFANLLANTHNEENTDSNNDNFGQKQKTHQSKHKKYSPEPQHKKRKKEYSDRSRGDSQIISGLFLVVTLVVAALLIKFQFNRQCRVHFDFNLEQLKVQLRENIFGQHVALRAIVSKLSEMDSLYSAGAGADRQTNVLTMSFHGWTGIGKNYISKFIVKSLPTANSVFFLIPLHFPHPELDFQYEQDLGTWLRGNITRCGITVFVIDEMDKATPGVIAAIQSVITELRGGNPEEQKADHRGSNSVDHSKHSGRVHFNVSNSGSFVIFMFLSNAKAGKVNQYLFSQILEGRRRRSITLDEFDPIFEETDGTEWYKGLQSKGQIDLFVPFLPLGEDHVRQCVIQEISKRGKSPTEELVSNVMKELSFFDPGGQSGQFSMTGCKRVTDKVDLHTEHL